MTDAEAIAETGRAPRPRAGNSGYSRPRRQILRRYSSHSAGQCGWAIVVVALSLTGCISFRAVSATGKLGERAGQHSGAFDGLYGVCLETVAVGEGTVDSCNEIPTTRTHLVTGLRAIAAYGKALRTLAEAENPDIEDNVTSALGAMPFEDLSDSADAIGQLVSTLTALLSQEYRRGQLREVVTQAAPTVRDLVSALETALQFLGTAMDAARASALAELRRMPIEGHRAERFVLAQTAAHVTGELTHLRDALRALRAFREAHAELDRSGDLSTSETLYTVVRAALQAGGAAIDFASAADDDESEPENESGAENAQDSAEGGPQ